MCLCVIFVCMYAHTPVRVLVMCMRTRARARTEGPRARAQCEHIKMHARSCVHACTRQSLEKTKLCSPVCAARALASSPACRRSPGTQVGAPVPRHLVKLFNVLFASGYIFNRLNGKSDVFFGCACVHASQRLSDCRFKRIVHPLP